MTGNDVMQTYKLNKERRKTFPQSVTICLRRAVLCPNKVYVTLLVRHNLAYRY